MKLQFRVVSRGPSSRDAKLVQRFLYGKVVRTRAPLPARFSRPLPTALAPRPWHGGVPVATIVDGLETGRGPMRQEVLSALRVMAAQGASAADMTKLYVGPLYGNRELSHFSFYLAGAPFAADLHRWILGLLASDEPLPIRQTLAWGLVDCSFPEAEAYFAGPDAPAEAVEERRRCFEHAVTRPSPASGGGEIDVELDRLGVTPARWAPPGPRGGSAAFDALFRRGRAWAQACELGQAPVDHALVMYRLARLVEGLDGVVFSQRAPRMDGARSDEEAGPYVLHAHFDGRHFRMHAENLGDYFDPEACVALVNSVLRARRSAWRVALDAVDEGATFFGGPSDALRALRRARLIQFGRY